MGKKKEVNKEVENIEVDTVEENKEQENTNTNIPKTSTGIGYEGNVTISILNGNKLVSKKQCHNAGTVYLFKFLCDSLANSANQLERPTMVRLFSVGGPDDTPDDPKWTNDTVASSAVVYDVPPISARDQSDNKKYVVSYHFRIPYSYITNAEIAKIALYAPYNMSILNNMSAYFVLRNGDAYDPIIMPVGAYSNYSVIIEWDLAITNQNL